MRKEKKRKIKGVLVPTLLTVAICIGVASMVLFGNFETVVTNKAIDVEAEDYKWITVKDAPVGEGIMYCMFYPHSATPVATYDSNLSNASAYEFSDVLNTSAGSDLPHSTTFDIVWKCAYPSAQAYNDTANDWDFTLVRGRMNSTGAVSFGETTATRIGIGNGTGDGAGYMYVHYIMNNAGSGYTVGVGSSLNTTLKQQYYG